VTHERSQKRICENCGAPLGKFAPAGLCARCLLEAGLSVSQTDLVGAREDNGKGSLGFFGNYELLEELGHGGMGIIYRARDLSVNRIVALKMILEGPFASERALKRFQVEAEAAAQLDHPNIVPVYEFGRVEGRVFLAMKLVEGSDLVNSLHGEPMDGRPAAELMALIARATHYAHQRGILHRDLKPANILVDQQGQPHVTDFGLAKLTGQESGLTLSSDVLGSPSYMSPEQASGKGEPFTIASDVYSLGAILYEILTGRAPFHSPSPLETMRKVVAEELIPPRVHYPRVERDLEIICTKCMDKEPAYRYGTALELAEDLERWLRHEPIRARPATPAERVAKWVRRNPKVVILLCLLCLVFGMGFSGILVVSLQLASANKGKERANVQLARNVRDFEWQKIDDLVATGKRTDALAYLSAFLRQNTNDRVAANRVVSMLSGCNFALPVAAPLVHDARVNTLDLGKDGQRLVTATDDGKVRIWHLGTSRVINTFLHSSKVNFAEFDADEQLVLTTCQDGISRLWDVTDGNIVFQFPEGVAGLNGILNLNRTLFALRETDVTMQVWDLRSRKRVGGPLTVSSRIREAAFSQDNQNIAIAASNGNVHVRAVDNSEELTASLMLGNEVAKVQFSPDGQTLAIVRGGSIELWNFRSQEKLKEFEMQDRNVLQIEFSPDGRRLVSMAYDRGLKIWDVASGQMLGQPVEAERPFSFFRFSPDGKQLATRSQSGVARLWDSFTGLALTEPFEHEGPITDLRFSPDGRHILTASQDGTVKMWQAQIASPQTFTVRTTDIYPCARFDREGQRVFYSTQGGVEIYDILTKQRIGKPMSHSGQVFRMDLSPDGKKLATAGWDSIGRVWDAQTGEPLTAPLPHRWSVCAIAVSPDNHLVATGSTDWTARLWNLETGQPVGSALQHRDEVIGVHFHPDSTAVLTASVDGTARLWSTADGHALWTEPLRHKGIVWSAEFSRDGRRIVTASADRSAVIWDTHSRQPVTHPLTHERGVFRAHFSPDGQWVLTCSEDGTARVWDASTGEPVSQPMRHKDKVGHADFSPNGRLVLTGSQDGTARLWDARTGYSVSDPVKHSGRVTSIQFSPDSRRCLSIANSDALRVCDVTDVPVPVPAWFCDFVEGVAGCRLNERKEREALPSGTLEQLKSKCVDVNQTDFYSRWGHWFLFARFQEPVEKFLP
jgi:eukaryotic-like serine/threonine-protein kinase